MAIAQTHSVPLSTLVHALAMVVVLVPFAAVLCPLHALDVGFPWLSHALGLSAMAETTSIALVSPNVRLNVVFEHASLWQVRPINRCAAQYYAPETP